MNYAASLRRLLRSVHRPKILEHDPFGVALKLALGASSVREALQKCIEQTFAADEPAWAIHVLLLQRFHLDQRVPRYRAAAELGVSPRRFYYLQAEAVDAVARHAQSVLRVWEGAPQFDGAAALLQTAALYRHTVSLPYHRDLPPVLQTYRAADAGLSGAFYALRCEYRGEREDALAHLERARSVRLDHLGHASRVADAAAAYVRGVMARHDGHAQRLSAAAQAAHAANAIPPGYEQWDALLGIEGALAHGDRERAGDLIDAAFHDAVQRGAHRYLLMVALQRAEFLLLRCDFDEAFHAADVLCAWAAAEADVLSAAAATRARACLALGMHELPPWPEPHSLWHAFYAEALQARADAVCGKAEKGAARASAVRRAAAAMRYAAIEAHSAGTEALVHNDVGAALDAWNVWLPGRHAVQGLDIVSGIPVRALLLHQATLSSVHRLALLQHSEWPVLPLLQDEQVAMKFWSAAISAALDNRPVDDISPLVETLLGTQRGLHAPDDGRSAVGVREFTRAVAMLVPWPERATFERVLATVLHRCIARTHRWMRRRRARTAIELT
jgi:hypothetical protein